MPIYEGIGLVSEKHSVVIDIGRAYTKCGFARDTGPRVIIPTEVVHYETKKVVKIWNYRNEEELYFLLKDFLHMLYFKHLVVSPKDRRVVVVESVLCPTLFRSVLAKVLFKHFECPSILFAPAHLMALFTLGLSSALVMDCGYAETIVLPIFEGVPMLNAWQAKPVGGEAIHRRIEAEMMDKALVKTHMPEKKSLGAVLAEPLKESILEDIKVRTCFVTPIERGHRIQAYEASLRLSSTEETLESLQPVIPPHDVEYPLDGEKVFVIPGHIREWAPELLFELDSDQQSIATLILDSILKCPRDLRRHLAENLVIIGGTAMLPGFKHRLLKELHWLLKQPQYSKSLHFTSIKIHCPPAKENYVAWLGGAIFGATDVVTTRSITQEQYLQNGYVPDWSDQKWKPRG